MSARDSEIQTTGIVLVGTHPWSHSAFDQLTPRPLLPVAHRPLVTYAFSWLSEGGVRNVAVCANRQTQVLETRLHRDVPPGMSVSYHEDAMPRGAAGAVRDAADASGADLFVVVDGTAIPNFALTDLLDSHRASGAAATVVMHNEPGSHGTPDVQAPTGVYVFNRKALSCVPTTGFYDIKENLISQLHRTGHRVSGFMTVGASPRVLDAASYLAVNEWMVDSLVSKGQLEGYVRAGDSLIHREATVAADATLVGPVLVGPGARIMSGTVVVGPTSIGREALLGNDLLVSRSAVWRRCVIRERAVVDRCIVGDDVLVGAGERLFRRVKKATDRRAAAEAFNATLTKEASSFDVVRRMSRALLGTSWSRYPAAP